MHKSKELPHISYIALLGPRDESMFTNVPQTSVTSPMLCYLGSLPQSMVQFVYGIEYYELLKDYGLQLGYDLKIVYPDSTQQQIDLLLEVTPCPRVILLCTDDEASINTYNALFNGRLDEDTLCVMYEKVAPLWKQPCAIATNKELTWKWFYDFAEMHYDIEPRRQPFSVPVFSKNLYDTGNVFSPSRVNTQILNSMLGNWGYSREMSDEEHEKERMQSSKFALQHKDGCERQDILIEQIKKIRAVETMVIMQHMPRKTLEDQYRSPLVIALPYTSIDMRKIERTPDMSDDDLEMADFTEAILGYHYTRNYTVWNSSKIVKTPEQVIAFNRIQQSVLEPRMRFFDIVGQLHCSMRFSPYLRLPIMGKNINSELSFVGIKNLDRLVKSPSKNKSIRKCMEAIGKKMVKEALAPSVVEMLKKSATQIVALTDLPVEWMMIDGVPLGFSHDVCRLPETPAAGMLSHYIEASNFPFIIPKDILRHTLVVFGNEDEAFVEAQQPVRLLSEQLGFEIRTCLSKQEFFETVESVNPQLLIVDTHGGVDEETHQSYLAIGEETITGDDVINSGIHPRLVFLSACNTFTTYNTISTIANAFFQAGSLAVTTSYMPVMVDPATILYTRLLMNLSMAATHRIHKNWLSFMSHLLRTFYIQAPIDQMVQKDMDVDLETISQISTKSMFFRNRRDIYNNLNNNDFTKAVGADYKYIIPHYLMYSTLGRADLIRFESSLDIPKDCDILTRNTTMAEKAKTTTKTVKKSSPKKATGGSAQRFTEFKTTGTGPGKKHESPKK